MKTNKKNYKRMFRMVQGVFLIKKYIKIIFFFKKNYF